MYDHNLPEVANFFLWLVLLAFAKRYKRVNCINGYFSVSIVQEDHFLKVRKTSDILPSASTTTATHAASSPTLSPLDSALHPVHSHSL